MLLDRIDAQQGWFLSRTVKGLHAALHMLEQEGYLEYSGHTTTTLYWRRKHG